MPETLGVPLDGEGLAWIVAQGFLQLNLLPGIRPDTILAAGLGNQPAVALLRARVQQHVEADAPKDHAFELPHELPGCECQRCTANPELRTKREHTWLLRIAAAKQDRLAAMHWLRVLCEPTLDVSDVPDADPLQLAAARGNLDMIKLLLAGPRPAHWGADALIAAAAHPKCLAWLLQHGLEQRSSLWDYDIRRALRGLARNGRLEAMHYIHDFVMPLPKSSEEGLMTIAAEHGHLPMVQWLRSLDPPDKEWPNRVCAAAAGSGNLSLLQWLRHQHPCPWLDLEGCTVSATTGGHLATLQWLCAQDPPCELSAVCTASAAEAGRMDLLKWLRAQQPPCPWYIGEEFDPVLGCSGIAAGRQDLAMLQWLHAHKCPWDAWCTLRAAEKGNVPMLQWMLAQDPPCPVSQHSMAAATLEGHPPMMQYLHGMGQPLNASLYYLAAEADASDALQWLIKQKVPAPARYLDRQDLGYRYHGQQIKPHMLMFLSDIGAPLPALLNKRATQYAQTLQHARRAYCTFHGLLRWSRRAVADPGLDTDRAFNRPSTSMAGERLLIRLSMLPQELIIKVATMAELQHGVDSCRQLFFPDA